MSKPTKDEVLAELVRTIEDVFYTASLIRQTGDVAAAQRIGDLGDKLHDEFMRLSKGLRQPILS